jgi:disulfide bond formation protein DsbB
VYSTVVTTLGFFAIVVFTGGLALLMSVALGGSRSGLVSALGGQEQHPLTWAWLLALVASTSSLYLSEIVGLVPCSLCWYQRIAMYPLVVVLGVAMFRRDVGVWRYGLPLSVIGLVIAVYHVTIQWQPTLDVGTCATGAPCTGRYLAVFGFISIPTMAGSVFLAVTALMLLLRKLESAAEEISDLDPADDRALDSASDAPVAADPQT